MYTPGCIQFRDKEEDLTGWLACNDAGKLGCIASCQSTGRLNLAFNGIGDREAEAFGAYTEQNSSQNKQRSDLCDNLQ